MVKIASKGELVKLIYCYILIRSYKLRRALYAFVMLFLSISYICLNLIIYSILTTFRHDFRAINNQDPQTKGAFPKQFG